MRLHYLVLETVLEPIVIRINSDLIILILQKDTYTTSSPGRFSAFSKAREKRPGYEVDTYKIL